MIEIKMIIQSFMRRISQGLFIFYARFMIIGDFSRLIVYAFIIIEL